MQKRGFFRRWVFPPFLGLTVYATIRLVDFLYASQRPWRDWKMDLLEMPAAILFGYGIDALVRWFVRRNTLRQSGRLTPGVVAKEFFGVLLVCQVLLNSLAIPLVALGGDGMQWYDFVIHINLIPSLYTMLYYAIARGNAHIKKQFEQQLELKEAENSRLETELKFLKAQLHPHFLFNALNTIYFQIDDDAAGAKTTIEKFSELLRYQLYDQNTRVKVGRELDYLRSYVDLQKIRTGERLHVAVDFDSGLNDREIYPLLLFPLVENAFKYLGGDHRICVRASQLGAALHFEVENTLPLVVHARENGSSGIGLENLRRRLELLYPQRHQLEFRKNDRSYRVCLNIEL